MKILWIFVIFLCPFGFFSCTKYDEIGTKIDDDYYCKPPTEKRDTTPNEEYEEYDEYFKHQWHLNAQCFSINIIPAWEITKGAGVKVAILDDGIQKNHEDFENIKVYNILDQSDNCEPTAKTIYSHGTAVAGVLAARQNGIGTIGVAPECDLLFIGDNSECLYSSDDIVIKAFEYAKNWGAQVISCSWGSYNVSSSLSSEIRRLYDDGIVIVFACGNDKKNMDIYNINDESELPWVIGVSSSDENGELAASFSNYGSNIDIMAPGTSILSLDLMGAEGSNNGMEFVNQNYRFCRGTSFSAPIVAGVAALILADNPSLTPKEVYNIITQTAQKTGNVQYDANGFSLRHAYGLIDAAAAINANGGMIKKIIGQDKKSQKNNVTA
ncbi:MAG: S8 family serine peptidase [Chitinispirillales bacterium]|jgi:subtilisin family serine protease|nr:S8 family serine peptidase [Chitinispirillales bacterium]